MAKQAYEMWKVFDCQDMPEAVKEAFFEAVEQENDSFVEWEIKTEIDLEPNVLLVDQWLIQNGAEDAPNDDDSGECVLIKHWW